MGEVDSYIWRSLFPESPRRRPCHRSRQAACRIQGQIYVYGGRDGHQTLQDFWRYDAPTNIWTRLECGGDTPPPLQEHTMIAHKGCIFIFGGELGYGSCGETPLWVYHLGRQTWEKPVIESEVVNPMGRRGHTAVVWRGGMHVYGGYVDLKGSSNEMWTLDFETRWWHLSVDAQLDNAPPPRHWHSAVAHGSNMWVYGGLNNLQPLRDLWKWNFECRQWTKVRGRQSPSFLHCHSAVCVVDSMMIFGGEDSEGEYRNELWKFHFGTASWHCVSPKRRITPTSCARHVMLSIPSNQIVGESPGYPEASGELRPQSAPTQAHRGIERETGRVLTPPSHLADLFVLRPHSSPPVVVGNESRSEDRRAHHFVNRVHPSPDEESGPRRTLFDSDGDEPGDDEVGVEDGTMITVGTGDEGDGGKTVDGKWAVAVVTNDARGSPQGDLGRTPNRTWAVTASVSPEGVVGQVKEKETSKLLANEESPVHQRCGDGGWKHRDESVTDASASPLHSNDCILEELLNESLLPPTAVRLNGEMTPSVVPDYHADLSTPNGRAPGNHAKCNNLNEADRFHSQRPQNTSDPKSPSTARPDINVCAIHHLDSMSSHTSHDPFGEPSYCTCNSADDRRGTTSVVSELPSIQEPEESKFVTEQTSPNKGKIIHVASFGKDMSENNNVEIVDGCMDRQKLLPSTNKRMATFVNYGFMSSHEDILHVETPQGIDVETHQSGPSGTITNGSTDQSDGVLEFGSPSGVTLYGHNRQALQPSNGFRQSQPPALILNGELDQSDAAHHPSRAMLYERKRHAARSEPNPRQRVSHVKPTNHRVCQITMEGQSGPNAQSNTNAATQQLQRQNQRSAPDGASSSIDSRPRLHGRSQTLNSLPDRREAPPARLQQMAGQPLRQDEDHQVSLREEEENRWVWPVFLYLMGGNETGASSLHQNSSPMSVWKCCIVQGKQTDSEIQHILSQY